MKIWKLVAGILSIIFSVIVFFQSMLVGTANTLSSNGEVGGSAGLFVSIFMLSGGIVSIVVRNSDLNIWAGWCLINMGLAIVSFVKLRKRGY